MAQPMTLVATPDPDDNETMPACPDFCDGTCHEWNDEDGGSHHRQGIGDITLAETVLGEPTSWNVSVSRTDADWKAGTLDINIHQSRGGEGATLTPAEARRLAALLLDAVDAADPAVQS